MASAKKVQPKRTNVKAYAGRWRIVSMECWDADYFDMEVAAYVIINEDLSGKFQFGLVQGQMNERVTAGAAYYRFTWSGFDENDAVSGRGWLRVDGDQAEGHIEFDLGDKSKFVAQRDQPT